MITDVVTDLLGGENAEEGSNEGITEFIENIDINNLSLKSTGEALQGISSYIEKTTDGFENYGEEVTQSEVSSIVNGLADNSFILDMLADKEGNVQTMLEVSTENQDKFESAINLANVDETTKDNLRKLFGLI